MADNFTFKDASLATGTGGADEVTDGTLGTVKVPYVKIMDGTLDGTTKVKATASEPGASDGGLVTREAGGGFVSTSNSSTATLTSGSVFTGTSESGLNYASATVYVFSDVASATDGLSIQQSSNGTNWDVTDTYTVPASTGKTFGVQITASNFRIVYTNGGTNQASFRLQVIFHKYMPNASSIRPQDARTNDNDMQEVVAYQALYNGTTWDRARGDTTSGAFVQVKNTPTVSQVPTTSGGVSTYSFLSTAAVQSAQIKGSSGQAYGLHFFNNSATIAYVRLYNQTGAPASTDGANIVWRGMIPANTNASGFLVHMEGTAFGTGIGIRVSAAVADNDTTVLAANAVFGNVLYK